MLWFYSPVNLLRLCQVGQLTYSHCYWADLSRLSAYPVLSAHNFASNGQLPYLNQWKWGEWQLKIFHDQSPWQLYSQAGIQTCNPWTCSQTNCQQFPSEKFGRTNLFLQEELEKHSQSNHWSFTWNVAQWVKKLAKKIFTWTYMQPIRCSDFQFSLTGLRGLALQICDEGCWCFSHCTQNPSTLNLTENWCNW